VNGAQALAIEMHDVMVADEFWSSCHDATAELDFDCRFRNRSTGIVDDFFGAILGRGNTRLWL
jgi:hypothetical protein